MKNYKTAVLIPTYNAGDGWLTLLESIRNQTLPTDIAVIDSASTDNTAEVAIKYGASVTKITRQDFTHGYARNKLIELHPNYDVYIFLTQDAVLASPQSLEFLLSAFEDAGTGVAFGRQLPHKNAGAIERHNRIFNYPATGYVRSKADVPRYGFKTIFCSNSFAAYRAAAYRDAGGFARDAFFGEDTLLTAKMINKGWKIAYVANATVVHSHNYTLQQEYNRYADIGRFHKKNEWLYKDFGKPSKEGFKFIWSELKYVLKTNPLLIFSMAVRSFNKWRGFKTGFKRG